MPFYGIEYGVKEVGAFLVAHRYSDLLKKAVELEWNERSQEHFYEQEGNVSMVPSARFLRKRAELAEEYGVGVAVWELGQGFPSWIELL